jgi:hypothetical protein
MCTVDLGLGSVVGRGGKWIGEHLVGPVTEGLAGRSPLRIGGRSGRGVVHRDRYRL